jgi:hypothetical protein
MLSLAFRLVLRIVRVFTLLIEAVALAVRLKISDVNKYYTIEKN